jgi:hypothetical protein
MKWNKFHKQIKNYMHPLFKDKIKFDYNGGWSNKFIILYEDKILAIYKCDNTYWNVFNEFNPVIPDDFGMSLKIMDEMLNIERQIKLYKPFQIEDAIIEIFNNLSIKEALNSDSKLIRAIALMDRRCGSRTFKTIDYSTEEDFLLRNIYNLRRYLENK